MSQSLNTVLLIDDDAVATRSMVQSLARRGHNFETLQAHSEQQARQLVASERPEAIVLDLSLSPQGGPKRGLEFLEELRSEDPAVRILILTGHDSAEYGVQALRRGAASFLSKPVDIEHLAALLTDAVQSTVLKRSYFQLANKSESHRLLSGLSSRSPAMLKVIESVVYAAANTQPVLLIGETGVGKGVIAQAIHRASTRKARPFIRVQPRFGNHDLTASEIFGHERGAFTGAFEARRGLMEEAQGGTLFLDEVDELPLETQVLLLHALQEKSFRKLGSNRELRSDFRLVAATNRPLEDSLREGKLRRDFYHRIAHFTIEIPPLRERSEDIADLSNDCLAALANRENLKVHGITVEAMERLVRHAWPGNVRELFAAVESAAYRAQFEGRRFVEAKDFALKKGNPSSGGGSFREQVRQFELRLIQEALSRSENNQTKAAELLQLDRSTLRRLLERGITR